MTYSINDQINYLVEHKKVVPIEEIFYINSIISSLEYLKLIMDTSNKEMLIKEYPNIEIRNKIN